MYIYCIGIRESQSKRVKIIKGSPGVRELRFFFIEV